MAFVFTILAVLFWNSWILGWLNHGSAGYLRMSISELNVIGQPHYFFFTILELISGILLAVAGLLLLPIKHKGIIGIIIAILICLCGLLTIYDSINPLDCNQYHNPICLRDDTLNRVSLVDKHHNSESVITDYLTGVLSLLTLMYFINIKASRKLLITLAVTAAAVITCLLILEYDHSIFTGAIAERIWNAVICADFLAFSWHFLKSKRLQNS